MKYSQGNQDDITTSLFKSLGTTTKFAVEFGFNSDTLTGGTGSNVARLVLEDGWQALLLDCDYENPAINLKREFLHPDNICSIFEKYNVPKNLDYLSIDVDSSDLWLLRALLNGRWKPKVISVEYNANFFEDQSFTVIVGTNWTHDTVYGASFAALNLVANEFEYELVACTKQLDLFFVPKDFKNLDPKLMPNIAAITGVPTNSKPYKERSCFFVSYPSLTIISDEDRKRLGWPT